MTIEVFYVSSEEAVANVKKWVDDGCPTDDENFLHDAGWYWWHCEPGCLPDSDPHGPFRSTTAAEAAARNEEEEFNAA